MSDQPFIKDWKQLLVVLVLAFVIPIVAITLITQFITGQSRGKPENDAGVLNRIKPVGEVVIAQAGAAPGTRTGEQAFQQVCKTCHEAGLAGAPKFGDKAAWTRVLAEGQKLAVDHAIHGIRGMPPKGGNPDFTDDEVHRAVAYMANAAGANWSAPPVAAASAAPASTSAPTVAAASAPAAVTPANTAATAAPATGGKADGKKVFDGTCMVCHGAGIAGAPKVGDKAAWQPRIQSGIQTLYANALRGKNAMPPKGGNTTLSDDEVKAAVDYMVSAAK